MSKEYILTDLTHNKNAICNEKIYDLVSQICLKYGAPGSIYSKIKDQYIYELWKHGDPYPSVLETWWRSSVKTIKWYIRNKIECRDEIWNGDFIWGLTKNGCDVKFSKNYFPSFSWYQNKVLEKIIRSSPFGGGITCVVREAYRRYKWVQVPALYLSHSEDSISYLAGVLSCGRVYIKDKINYVGYNRGLKKYFESLGIPIERECNRRRWVLISPIWPALFSLRMPECVKNEFVGLKGACNVNLYAPILWKTYNGENFIRRGIPYLPCRRKIYYDFAGEKEGAMPALDRLRVEKNLVALDYRVRDIVKLWKKEKCSEKNKKSEIASKE